MADIIFTREAREVAREPGSQCSWGPTGEVRVQVFAESISGSLIETGASRSWSGGSNAERFSFRGEFVEDMQPFSGKLTVWTQDQEGNRLGSGEFDVTLTPE